MSESIIIERTECTYPNCKGCRQCGIKWHIDELKDYEGVKLMHKFCKGLDRMTLAFRARLQRRETAAIFQSYLPSFRAMAVKQKFLLCSTIEEQNEIRERYHD